MSFGPIRPTPHLTPRATHAPLLSSAPKEPSVFQTHLPFCFFSSDFGNAFIPRTAEAFYCYEPPSASRSLPTPDHPVTVGSWGAAPSPTPLFASVALRPSSYQSSAPPYS